MNGRFLLDTNIVIGLFKDDEGIKMGMSSGAVYLPVVAVAELYFGAARSGRPVANRALVDDFISGLVVINCDLEVARAYGLLKSVLRAQGTPIPENDIWIAAIASTHQLPLVTRDKHFLKIPGLELVQW